MTSTLPTPRRPLAVAIALALGASGTQAATIIVTDGGDAGTATTCTLRQAIESSNNDNAGSSTCVAGNGNDTIVFDGNLVDTTVTLSQGQLEFKQPVTLDSTGQTRTIDAGGASRVLYVNTATFTANSLTLTGGAAPPGASGGGILSNAGTINLTNTTISGNLASKGGGVYATNTGTITLTNCTLSGNTAVLDGGGLFAGNTVTATLGNNTISGNTAGMHGGGVYGTFFTVTFTNTTISGNTAGQGGGVWSSTGNTSFTDSSITGNKSSSFGGVYAGAGTVTLTNTTVSGNTVTDAGGGVFGVGGTLTLTNTTISGNASQVSGGFGTQSGTVTFANTILGNNAGGDCSASNSTISAAHTLVADAASASACGIGVGGANGNIVGQDPLLAPLADNGGPTQTMALDAVSPALNAGSVALATFGNDTLNYDQRGVRFPRTLDANVDIGAYQHQGDRVLADGLEAEP